MRYAQRWPRSSKALASMNAILVERASCLSKSLCADKISSMTVSISFCTRNLFTSTEICRCRVARTVTEICCSRQMLISAFNTRVRLNGN